MPSVLDILRPSVVMGLMNEVKTPYERWQDYFGLGPKGAANTPSEVRSVYIDIVNDDRTVATLRAPGDDAQSIAPLAIGTRIVVAPRSFEKMTLSYEILNNIRQIGEGASELDRSGLTYVKHQMAHMKRRTARFREWLLWGAQRGTVDFLIGTDQSWIPVTGGSGTVTFDWQLPSSHKNQINPGSGNIILTSWDSAGAPIITDIANICAFAESESGLPIEHAWCNSSRWVKILNNSQVRNMGGSAQEPFKQWETIAQIMKSDNDVPVGKTLNEITGVLRGWPNITWHVTDRVINLNGTVTKYLGDNDVFFQPEPSDEWIRGVEVKESTNQVAGQSPVDVYGNAYWVKYPYDADVAKYIGYALDNFMVATSTKSHFFATVGF